MNGAQAPLRLGRIGYVNCLPVYAGIDRGAVPVEARLVTGTPSELNDLLAVGELDVSVVSAVEYARHAARYHLLSGIAVSCDGPVRSVALFSTRPVEDLSNRTVLVSASSRTSVALLELLCQDLWKIRPNFAEARAEAADLGALEKLPHDAVLVIGDAALLLAARGLYRYRYDVGEVWKAWTGLPFVFAVWAARREADPQRVAELHKALLASRDWGLSHLDELAAEAARETGIGLRECQEYLSGLDYAFTYRHLEGLTSFFRRLASRGMVSEASLSFLSVA